MAVVWVERVGAWIAGVLGLVPARRALAFSQAFTVTDVPGQTLTAADDSVTGYVYVDLPSAIPPSSAATAGSASAALYSTPLAQNSAAGIDYRILATDGTYEWSTQNVPASGFATYGSPGAFGGSPSVANSFPIAPSVASTWTLIVSPTGVFAVTVRGPGLTVTGCADNGSGKVRVAASFAGSAGFTAAITGESVTIAGVVGTVETNGAHVATFVDAGHVDLAAVAYVNAYVSGGTLVETTPRSLTWTGRATFTVTP